MNQTRFIEISQNPELIEANDAHLLENMIKDFPFYTFPYVLLAHHYKKTNDYRFEKTLHKAALRVADRAKLKNYLFKPAAVVEEKTIQDFSESIRDVSSILTETELTPVANIELESAETTVALDQGDQNLTQEKIADIEFIDDSSLVEFNVLPDVSFVFSTEEAKGQEETIVELEKWLGQSNIEPLSNELVPEEKMIDEVVQEIAESAQPNSLDQDVEEEIKPKLVKTAAVYNIEDYFGENKPEEPIGGMDFFAWLSNPKRKPEEVNQITEESKEKNKTLIDTFIKKKPSIQRPKADFFTPINAAKKSEVFPLEMATETLAKIYTNQGNLEGAIGIYEKLQLKFPEKSAYFAALIEEIRKNIETS